jgi:spore coat protein H
MKLIELFRKSWIGLGTCFVLISTVPQGHSAAVPAKPSGKERNAAFQQLFDSTNVLRLKIEIPKAAMEILGKYQWKFGPQTDREVVQVTVREGAKVYTNVALHLKGAAGSFRPVDDTPAMTLNFDKFAKGQYFHGLEKLSLNNSVQDPTFLSEQFSRELFLKAGVPVPRATHAKVELNGKDLGLYVMTEGWDKEFLKRHFKNTKGNLYDGGFVKDVTDELSTNSGDEPKNQSDRIALVKAAGETNLTSRLQSLEKTLDVDRFLTFIALDVMLWNWDGYAMNKNNWRLYHDMDKGRMIFLPHGLDQMFWKPDGSILPPMQGLVATSALQIPELRKRYFDRLKQLRATVFNVEALTNRVQQIAAKIKPVVAGNDAEAARRYKDAVDGFCVLIARRGQSLDRQLANPIEPIKFDNADSAPLAGWQSKSDFGKPKLARSEAEAGKKILQIGTTEGSSIGSWKTTVWLERGRYRVAGKVKTQGLVADVGDPFGGAGFRLAKGRPDKYVSGSTDWKDVDYEFSVQDTLAEVQILCEFRSTQGEAFFDADSLNLKRISTTPQPAGRGRRGPN